jgi:RNA polymerase sigma-70 factor (ECF subfamily)
MRSSDPARTALGLVFPSTRWELVFKARSSDPAARDALNLLCQTYWEPIYSYLRRRGHSPGDAEDQTQQFFAEVIADETFRAAQPERGRLRTFLLAALKRSLADQARFRNREKRGGGIPPLSLEWARAEKLLGAEPVEAVDPEKLFYRQWAQLLIERARDRLRESYASRAALYAAIEPFLEKDDASASYAAVAAELNIAEVTVRVHVSRLRKRWAELLREEIRDTVQSESEVEPELQWLLAILARR